MDQIAIQFFGMTSQEAKEKRICISCKRKATVFRDQLSKTEYQQSTLCQTCQDETFDH